MRQLDGCPGADLDADREAFDHGPLGGPDEAHAALAEVVVLEIEADEEPPAQDAPGGHALDEHEALFEGLEDAPLEVAVHGIADGSETAVLVGTVQVCLGIDEAERGRRRAHVLVDPLPVFWLGGELVAGHHGPSREVRSRFGQEYPGDVQGDALKAHGGLSSLMEMCTLHTRTRVVLSTVLSRHAGPRAPGA